MNVMSEGKWSQSRRKKASERKELQRLHEIEIRKIERKPQKSFKEHNDE